MTPEQKDYLIFYYDKMRFVNELLKNPEVIEFANQTIVGMVNAAEVAKKEYIKKYGSFPSMEEIKRILNTGESKDSQ